MLSKALLASSLPSEHLALTKTAFVRPRCQTSWTPCVGDCRSLSLAASQPSTSSASSLYNLRPRHFEVTRSGEMLKAFPSRGQLQEKKHGRKRRRFFLGMNWWMSDSLSERMDWFGFIWNWCNGAVPFLQRFGCWRFPRRIRWWFAPMVHLCTAPTRRSLKVWELPKIWWFVQLKMNKNMVKLKIFWAVMHDGFLLKFTWMYLIYIYIYIYMYIAFGCPERLSPAFQGLCHWNCGWIS